jgi:F420-dependent oxidoreductase-like protein
MKFGLHNPSWVFGSDPYEMFEEVKRKAQWAESHGFAMFSVMDHFVQMPGIGAMDEPFMESWTTLAALAAVTSKIRLAILVSSVSFRNPALLAKMAANVDVISRGRLTLGMGAGAQEEDYRQYGWEFPRLAVRIRQMEEAIRLIKTMWIERRATFHGEFFHVQEAILEPKPVQRPHPPVVIGGGGEQLTLRAVARVGNACNFSGDIATIKRKYDVLRRHCDAVGRNFDEIERTVQSRLLIARDQPALKAKMERLNITEQVKVIAVTVPQAIDTIGCYREAGGQTLIASIHRNDTETLELLAHEVMPHFT